MRIRENTLVLFFTTVRLTGMDYKGDERMKLEFEEDIFTIINCKFEEINENIKHEKAKMMDELKKIYTYPMVATIGVKKHHSNGYIVHFRVKENAKVNKYPIIHRTK